MAKIALLIGVSEYQSGFRALPAAVRDVEAVQRVLQDSLIGDFAATDVTTLMNPDPQQVREALVTLFRDRQKSDTLLLYFSGHGVTDEQGKFYLTCARTKPDLLEATAIPADFVHQLMGNSRSKQQIVVLDCCFSGAFAKGMAVKGESVNLAAQLSGQGRAVLTSSSATEYSFEQKESDLSVYTRYWVEGLQTGAADEDGDGWISVDELQSYTSRKVRESAPAMKPQIYAVEEGYKIILAKAPVDDPQLEYRREVERLAQERKGVFSPILLDALEQKRKTLNLSIEVAQTIQGEVLRPYEELKNKLQQYEQAVISALASPGGFTQTVRDDLLYLQQTLGLRNADVETINNRMPRQTRRSPSVRESAQVQQTPTSEHKNTKLLMVLGSLAAVVVGALATVPFFSSSNRPSFPPSNQAGTVSPSAKSAEAFFNEGLQKYNAGDFAGALADYNEAIRLNPNYAEAYNNRGNAKADLGDKEGAIADYTRSIELKNPELHMPYNNRGLAKAGLGDRQGAITDYTEAIRLNPNYAEAYNNRGIARSDLGDKPGAIADYDKAIILKPDYAEAFNNRGTARSDFGDKQGAINDYTQAIRLKPNYADAYRNRGLAKFDLGDTKGAIADYTEAIRLNPTYADAFHNRGYAKARLGDKQGALADYREAAKLYQQQGNDDWYQKTLNQIQQLEQG